MAANFREKSTSITTMGAKTQAFDIFPIPLISHYPLPLTLSLAAIKKCIEWRLQVQIAFSTEVDLEPSRPE
jgi:hypothetical protein